MKIKFILTIVLASIIMSCQDEDTMSNENDKELAQYIKEQVYELRKQL